MPGPAAATPASTGVVAALLTLFAVRVAVRPPDQEHHYGHGKAESLAGLFQAAVITFSGLFLVREAVRRLPRLRGDRRPGQVSHLRKRAALDAAGATVASSGARIASQTRAPRSASWESDSSIEIIPCRLPRVISL